MGKVKVQLITSCSSSRVVPPIVKVEDMPTNLTMSKAMHWWLEGLEKSEVTVQPREQYRGTGFVTLAKILAMDSSTLEISSRIVTGGQGLINLEEDIVPYDFSASVKDEHHVKQKVTAEPFVQTVWWQMINEARYNTSTPVADYIDNAPDDCLTIVSMPKLFVRYISEDLLSAKKVRNVRILLAASSIGSVPAQLKPYIIPYGRNAIAHVPGNRNDTSHRAALVFIQMLRDNPELAKQSAAEHARLFGGQNTGSGVPIFATDVREAIKQALADQPGLLQLRPDECYEHLRKELGALGGRIFFRGIFRAEQQAAGMVPIAETSPDDAAVDALKVLNLQVSDSVATEDEALEWCQLFVSAIRAVQPKAMFTSADLIKWATHYAEAGDKEVPEIITRMPQLTALLKANAQVLRIELAANGKNFALQQEIQNG